MNTSKKDSVEYIYTAFITLKNGKRIYASQYGLKAFYIPVKSKNKQVFCMKNVDGFILL